MTKDTLPGNQTKFDAHSKSPMGVWILGGALVICVFALIGVFRFDAARLALFGPTAYIYFSAIQNGLAWGTAILSITFMSFLFFEKQTRNIIVWIKSFFLRLSNQKQRILVLILCFLFVFVSNAENVIYGYFNMDDLTVVGLNHSLPFSKAVITPYGNDHAFPLFITEMKVLDILFGKNPVPYNFFFLILFSLIPFFVYLSFKKLGLSLWGFIAFLIIFAGAPAWTEIITGFYIMSIYPQILLFFSMASWSYLSWRDSHAMRHMVFFAFSLILALASDTSGIWVIPVIILFMLGVHLFKKDAPTLEKTS